MRGIERLAGCVVVAAMYLLPVPGEAQTSANAKESATEELRSLMTTALGAARAGDHAKLEEIARNLMVPNYEAWFKSTFGEEEGTKLATAYKVNFDRQEKWIPTLFASLSKQEGEVLVEDAREPRYAGASNQCGRALMKSAKSDAVFYRVSLQEVLHPGLNRLDEAGYFTLVEGAYRRLDCKDLGLARVLSAPPPLPMPGSLRVSGNVQAKRIISRVPPVYPMKAREERISGTVCLRVLIAKDGTVEQVEVVSGHPLLQQAAVDAVRQWRYQSTFLNGNPVEIDTTVDLIFSLNNPPTPNP